MRVIILLALGLANLLGALETLAQETQQALFLSGNHTLQGVIYKPKGKGPFPAVIFNQQPDSKPYSQGQATPYPGLAKVFVKQGYVFFVPGRHDPDLSQKNDDDNTKAGEERRLIQSHEHHAANALAALAWLKAQIYVDETRIAMIGDTAGGVTTLVASGQGSGLRGVVVFSPGVTTLGRSPALRDRLKNAIQQSKMPILLLQAQNDHTLAPKNMLGPALEKKGGLNRVRVYPSYGSTPEDVRKLVTDGCDVWHGDVFSFLHQAMERTSTIAASDESGTKPADGSARKGNSN